MSLIDANTAVAGDADARYAHGHGLPRRPGFPGSAHDERSLMGLGKDMLKRSVGIGLIKDVKQGSQAAKLGAEMLADKDQMLAQAAELRAANQVGTASSAGMAMPGAGVMPPAGPIDDADLEPIAGVSLEKYVEISKGLAEHGYDQSKATLVAASKGVSADAWETAVAGWNDRIKANRAVGQRFNQLYMGG
jgi:hypothetical protein